jgi:hypothetical protein
MNRSELIRRMVLSEISDDYENVDRIIPPHLTKDCSKLGIAIERSEIVKALGELVGDGLASAYLLSPIELRGMPALDGVEENFETWFYITRKGMDFHLSDDSWWPFRRRGRAAAKLGPWRVPSARPIFATMS